MREKENIPDLVRRAMAQPLVVHVGEAADFADSLGMRGVGLRPW